MPFWTLNRPHDRGRAAEQAARHYLEQQGLQLIAANYACRLGELDLVMREPASLVFVEVRYRSRNDFGSPQESLGYRKRQRLWRTAEHFLQHHPRWQTLPCRFDMIAATPDHSGGFLLEWLQNAISTE